MRRTDGWLQWPVQIPWGSLLEHSGSPGVAPSSTPAPLMDAFLAITTQTEALCEPLQVEDYGLQAMPEVSPAKWHLAHTAWYFETFVLAVADPDYRSPWPAYRHLFNSYYNGVGNPFPRPQRGLLSRPSVEEVYAYRQGVRERICALWDRGSPAGSLAERIELGIHHEQQHQELLLTDLKYSFSRNPLAPAYQTSPPPAGRPETPAAAWRDFPGGMAAIGHGGGAFSFDNERPQHRVLLQPYQLARAPVSNRDFMAFMEDGGYQKAALWLSDGWAELQASGAMQPLYWAHQDGHWWHFTLHGMQAVDADAPVAHLSYFEADAYARWAGARLPTEAEWECAAQALPVQGNFRECGLLAPAPRQVDDASDQMFGDVWEWTSSNYTGYPGYRPFDGELGEYNGKFMCNQFVLRGGSCVSPAAHLRSSYRNFFYPRDRWQFSGMRLARDAS